MADLADEIRKIAEQVLQSPDIRALLAQSGSEAAPAAQTQAAPAQPAPALAPAVQAAPAGSRPGIYGSVDAAVAAAAVAQRELVALPLGKRKACLDAMRRVIAWNNRDLSTQAVAETGLGNVTDKMAKNTLAAEKTPGVEDVEPWVRTDEHGLTLTELAPWGVIGTITPMTNPIATIVSNAIGMIAAGNTVVFNVHPNAKGISNRLIGMLNEAIMAEGGPRDLLCAVAEPTLETAGQLMKHPGIQLLVVTGGPAVVRAAMGSGRKSICAGPGNPPCVVDQTADLVKAGRDIVAGAGFDHGIVCICEKEVLAVESIADRLKDEMKKNGAFELTGAQIDAVTRLVIADPGGPGKDGAPNKAWVGKAPADIARAAGVQVPDGTKILLMEVGRDHPLVWTEQLMPVLPLVRMKNVDEAIDFAVVVEHGYRHTAMMHSHDVEKLSRMARAMDCSLFVKNGPCVAGLGYGGAGHTSFTIASPTGDGITRPRTFTRERRCTLVDAFRIV
ncbi:MAG: aldehyde dehydrogenase EutE [Spirochaetia bacterium]|nr:aldehyde dehydrogenase EutE [Spirochaetia bacterium]